MPDISNPKIVDQYPCLENNEKVIFQFDTSHKSELFRSPDDVYYMDIHVFQIYQPLQYIFQDIAIDNIMHLYRFDVPKKVCKKLIIKFICATQTQEQLSTAIILAEPEIVDYGNRFEEVQVIRT
jgi:hypothetical protein